MLVVLVQLRCNPDAFSASGCTNYNDTYCVCRCPAFQSTIAPCQLQDCKGEDLNSTSRSSHAPSFLAHRKTFPFMHLRTFILRVTQEMSTENITDLIVLALVTLVESLCAPVGGTIPSVPSACRVRSGNGTACGTGLSTSVRRV